MWKVKLENDYNRIKFRFECFNEASDFAYKALSTNKNIEVSISIEDVNDEVKGDEEDD